MYTFLFFSSCFSTIIQCGTLHTRLQSMGYGSYVTDGLYTDPLDSLWGGGGGGCAWNDHWYSVYSIFIYTHTVSLLRGLTVSVMDAVFTWSFHEFCSWIVMFTFTHRRHEGLTVSRGQRSHVPERTVFNSVKYVARRKTSCEAS